MATSKGGYDYEFINPPPQSLECSICLLTLRDPHVTTCCGNQYCQVCINRIQRDNKPCPLCNEPGFTTFLHKGVAREVKALKVYCAKKPQGCDWQGELGQVDQHLNPGPAESRERGCGFVMVECRYECGGQFQRRMIEQHKTEDCPRRPVADKQIAFIMKRLTELPNEVQCIKEENRALKRATDAVVAELKAENTALKQQIDARPPPPVPPFYYSLINYNQLRKNNSWLFSTPFYSHQCGYKMKIHIFPNGDGIGRNTHLSVFIGVMRGEYDDQLDWPFTGKVTVEMYNFRRDQWSQTMTIDFRENPVEKATNLDANTCGSWGYYQYMSNYELKANFLHQNDVIRFRIADVQVTSC